MGEQLFYYHPDHLGSTGYVTRENGKLHEHIQYFPFGETWVQQGGNTEKSPYLFTSKELDEETGLYYFGARYYDPKTSVWQSADQILEKYLPTIRNGKIEDGLVGGVYETTNLGLYTYSRNTPVMLSDPDGNAPPFPYTNLNGIKAHNVFSGYAKARGMEANMPLNKLLAGLTGSRNRPDAYDPRSGAVYELKPISRSKDPAKVADDRAQVEGYVSEINKSGSYAYAGDPTDLAPDVAGGTNIGQITDEFGNENNVNIYPGDTSGLIYYALQPTGRNELVEGAKDVAEGVAKNGPFAPSRWIIQPPSQEFE